MWCNATLTCEYINSLQVDVSRDEMNSESNNAAPAHPEQPSTSRLSFNCVQRVNSYLESVAMSQSVSKTKLKARIHKKKTELEKLKTTRRKIKERLRLQADLLTTNEMEIDEVRKDVWELEATLKQVEGGELSD